MRGSRAARLNVACEPVFRRFAHLLYVGRIGLQIRGHGAFRNQGALRTRRADMWNLHRTPSAIALVLALSGATVVAATLTPAALSGWGTYVGATERRIARELT